MKNNLRAVAYCRVSTNKEEQLDSLESQEKFFHDYSTLHGYELIHVYADEGKSGTKMKNRRQLIQLLEDAKESKFDLVLIKDVSRLARNTVDFLTSIRKLKSLHIKVVFVNYDQTSSDSSEFMLTMLSAIAQEESANTSKRVRFGKKQNAKLGRVPNLVFGYDKIPGDYFHLKVNEEEKKVVKKIFELYTEEKLGTSTIARRLNEQGIKTKRGCLFTQTSITRILSNEIYIGNVVNGKEEVSDFLTGERKEIEESNWIRVNRPELAIISKETFMKAQKIMSGRKKTHEVGEKKQQTKYIFSQLIICKECNEAYRRITRTYRNTYHNWVCSTRNIKGKSACANAYTLNEDELMDIIFSYLFQILSLQGFIIKKALQDYYRKKDSLKQRSNVNYSLNQYIENLNEKKQKYIKLYTNDLITIEELKKAISEINEKLKVEQMKYEVMNKSSEALKDSINKQSDKIEYLIRDYLMSNTPLRKLLEQIEVDIEGNVNIYFKKIM